MPMIWSSKRKMEILVRVVKLIEHSLQAAADFEACLRQVCKSMRINEYWGLS
jgi:hypothetical protein